MIDLISNGVIAEPNASSGERASSLAPRRPLSG